MYASMYMCVAKIMTIKHTIVTSGIECTEGLHGQYEDTYIFYIFYK